MASAIVIIALLTIVASLASWLFGQWFARRARMSAAALAIGGGGAVLLISAVAFIIVGASSGWPQLIPVQEFSSPATPASTARSTDAWPMKHQPEPVLEAEQPVAVPEPGWLSQAAPPSEVGPAAAPKAVARHRFGEPKDGMLDEAERHLEASEHASAIDVARRYLADHPNDTEMNSVLARSLFAAEHPGAASILPAVVIAEWPATGCIASTRSDESARWMLDNGCGRVVAVLFASCELSESACFTNTVVSQGWRYEPTGILMTAANDRPVPLRLGERGPLVAPIFTIRDAGTARRQIRYLACEVTAPGVLQALHESGGELSEQRLTAELRADACYTQVLAWSSSGQRTGASPDSLLRNGID